MKLGGWRRILLSVGVGVGCLVLVLAGTGLLTGRPVGAGDNGDGSRLYCGAGLVPATPDGLSNWKGGVVVEFNRSAVCEDPMPSSVVAFLRVAAFHSGDGWSLTRLGWLYAVVAAATITIAAWAAMARRAVGVLILVPAVLPLVHSSFSRFFISTFSEASGLAGAFALLCGVGVLVVTRRTDFLERLIGILLVAGGSLMAATAKAGYAPLLAVGVLVCAVTAVSLGPEEPRWRERLMGPALAIITVLVVIAPMRSSFDWQSRRYATINAHNFTYTTVLTEVPGSAEDLGLPAEAAEAAGNAYYPWGTEGVPGAEVIAANPAEARSRATRVLASHPGALMRSVGIAMQATRSASLSYLPSAPMTPETTPTVIGTSVGEQGVSAAQLHAWLDGMRLPWVPSLLAAVGLLAGIAGVVRRRRPWSAFARLAGVSAIAGLGLAVAAVLGDGYFEIAKHVWLTAYLLEVTLFALIGAAISAGVQILRPERPLT